jgi:ribose transport system ATP-binding protein
VIAKWLRVTPSVLLVDEPTQGVDVGSSESIRALLVAAAADGMSVLICSSDNADLVRMCSRVLVMRDGVVACELRGTDITDHRITQECLGSSVSERRADAHSPSEATYV